MLSYTLIRRGGEPTLQLSGGKLILQVNHDTDYIQLADYIEVTVIY